MNARLNIMVAQERIQDLRRAADRARMARSARPKRRHTAHGEGR